MKKRWLATLASLAAALTGTGVWLQGQLADNRPVASLLPPGALLYLEAKDFNRLLGEWNGSAEKKLWLSSKNFEELSVSRLIQRLGQAGDEFGTVAGVPVGMSFTNQVAGTRSGFAFYDLGKVHFIYLTQMGQSRIEASELWQKRSSFRTREASGVPFFVKADGATGREIAFASYKGWFLVGTDVNRMAAALALLSGGKEPSLATEDWFAQAAGKRQDTGDLRLLYNMEALLRTPQFRTYWLHRNASQLKEFASGISDLYERPDGFGEERVLLKRTEGPAPETSNGLADAERYGIAGGSSLLRAWSKPSDAQLAEAVQQVVLAERSSGGYNPNEPAPGVSLEAGAVGSEADLETRIDEVPYQRAAEQPVTPVVAALRAMEPLALAHVQGTTELRDQVFVLPQSGLVVVCARPDRAALDRALQSVANETQTGSLDPLTVAVNGQAVVISRVALGRSAATPAVPSGVTYVARYDHAVEWPHYKKLFSMLDSVGGGGGANDPGLSARTPSFFNGNLRSLGESLARLQSASIFSADTGATVKETLQYQLAKP